MGNGMNKIITGVYVGNFRDAKDQEQLNQHNITHILSIHDNAQPLLKDKKYLCIKASDTPDQSLTPFFKECNEFIHEARLEKGNVLIHCLAGVSRSVTVTAAYIMTVSQLGWRDTLNAIRGARSCANPNFGFQKQLQQYDSENLEQERKAFRAKYPDSAFEDDRECEALLKCHRHFVATGETKAPELYALPPNAYEKRNRRRNNNNNAQGGATNGETETADSVQSTSAQSENGAKTKDDQEASS